MLGKPGTKEKLGNLANLMITDPKGMAKHYVPDSEDVIVYTDMTNPKGSFTIHFNTPKRKRQLPLPLHLPRSLDGDEWRAEGGVRELHRMHNSSQIRLTTVPGEEHQTLQPEAISPSSSTHAPDRNWHPLRAL